VEQQWRVLLADDDPAICTLIDTVLQRGPYRTVTCSDAEAALHAVRQDEAFDVIICDFMLPGISGLELVERLRAQAHTRRTPILMISGHGHRGLDGRSRTAGANMFLNKPFTMSQLREALVRLLPGGADAPLLESRAAAH